MMHGQKNIKLSKYCLEGRGNSLRFR